MQDVCTCIKIQTNRVIDQYRNWHLLDWQRQPLPIIIYQVIQRGMARQIIRHFCCNRCFIQQISKRPVSNIYESQPGTGSVVFLVAHRTELLKGAESIKLFFNQLLNLFLKLYKNSSYAYQGYTGQLNSISYYITLVSA